MSDERKAINTAMSENTDSHWHEVTIDSLPLGTIEDICHNIAERQPFCVREHIDAELVRANLVDLQDPVTLWRGTMEVPKLHATMSRTPSEGAVAKYRSMLSDDNFEFDPILVADGMFLDGGNRLESYMLSGRKVISVVDISPLLKADDEFWQAWIGGEENIHFTSHRPMTEDVEQPTDDELRTEIVKLCAHLPYIWRGQDGTNHHKNFHIEHFIRDKDRQWLLHCIEDGAYPLNSGNPTFRY